MDDRKAIFGWKVYHMTRNALSPYIASEEELRSAEETALESMFKVAGSPKALIDIYENKHACFLALDELAGEGMVKRQVNTDE